MYDQTVAKDIHFLLGRVSLNPKDFYKIIQFAPEYIESKNIIKNKNK